MQKILDCFVAFGSSQRRRRYRGHLRCHSGAPRRGEPGIHVAACRAVRWIPGSRCARPGMTSEGGAMRSLLSLRAKRPVADAQRSKAEAIQRYAEDSGLLRRLRLLATTEEISRPPPLSFRGASKRRARNPCSRLPRREMDSGLALRAPRNDERGRSDAFSAVTASEATCRRRPAVEGGSNPALCRRFWIASSPSAPRNDGGDIEATSAVIPGRLEEASPESM